MCQIWKFSANFNYNDNDNDQDIDDVNVEDDDDEDDDDYDDNDDGSDGDDFESSADSYLVRSKKVRRRLTGLFACMHHHMRRFQMSSKSSPKQADDLFYQI